MDLLRKLGFQSTIQALALLPTLVLLVDLTRKKHTYWTQNTLVTRKWTIPRVIWLVSIAVVFYEGKSPFAS